MSIRQTSSVHQVIQTIGYFKDVAMSSRLYLTYNPAEMTLHDHLLFDLNKPLDPSTIHCEYLHTFKHYILHLCIFLQAIMQNTLRKK